MAILKFEVWYPAAKHGSTKHGSTGVREYVAKRNPYHKNHGFAASFRFLSLPSKVLFRSAQPYFVPGWQIAPFKIAASGAGALLAMTQNR